MKYTITSNFYKQDDYCHSVLAGENGFQIDPDFLANCNGFYPPAVVGSKYYFVIVIGGRFSTYDTIAAQAGNDRMFSLVFILFIGERLRD